MNALPLRLEAHFFTAVVVEPNQRFQPELEADAEDGIHAEVHLAQHKDNPRKWSVALEVTSEVPDKNLPYKINLECMGFFEVAPEVEEKQAPMLVRTNGASILYSSAREFLLLITGRGPWGPFYLPTKNFLKPFRAEEEKAPPTRTRKPAPKKRKLKTRPAS
ncbi:MAG: protein-export chaperone SecB [Deltaproteobacteria bacterium]|nr:protein-export chaperone SecB [Deltaproteobacteria bacterium]